MAHDGLLRATTWRIRRGRTARGRTAASPTDAITPGTSNRASPIQSPPARVSTATWINRGTTLHHRAPTNPARSTIPAALTSSVPACWRPACHRPGVPILINVGGQEQIVGFGTDEVYGADPTNGNLLWSYPHKTEYGLNISTPIWNAADGLLFISSAYGVGSRALQLTRNGDRTAVKQAWENKRVRIHFGTAIRVGDYVYGSSGDFGPAFFTAINVKTGQIAWQERGLARASFVYADSKLVILDEDGTLAIAAPLPSGLNILAQAPVMKNRAWTGPTLAGTKLYLRDRRMIVALDLG